MFFRPGCFPEVTAGIGAPEALVILNYLYVKYRRSKPGY